jgi:tRNA(fMet)-specific endonuclease VapC
MSIITYMEAVEGVLRSGQPVLARRELDVLIGTVPVLPFLFPEADASARLRDALRRRGSRVRSRSLDLIIAATALERGLTLVTNNIADYRDITGLSLVSANII